MGSDSRVRCYCRLLRDCPLIIETHTHTFLSLLFSADLFLPGLGVFLTSPLKDQSDVNTQSTRSAGKGVNTKLQVVKQSTVTTCSHHANTGLFLRSSLLTNCLPERLLIQLGDLTNAPYMILFLLIVAAIS